MRIADYATSDLIATGLEAGSKDDLLRQLVQKLIDIGHIHDDEILMRDLLKRERVMSTGIGGGIAIPHALSTEIDHLVIVFGRTAEPIDFQSLDSHPVDLIFMLVGPKTSANLYVKLLARVSRLLQNESFKSRLRNAGSVEEILEVFILEEEAQT